MAVDLLVQMLAAGLGDSESMDLFNWIAQKRLQLLTVSTLTAEDDI